MNDQEAAKAFANKWCDDNPMNQRDAEGLTSWGVLAIGFRAGAAYKQAQILEMLRSDDDAPVYVAADVADWLETKLKGE